MLVTFEIPHIHDKFKKNKNAKGRFVPKCQPTKEVLSSVEETCSSPLPMLLRTLMMPKNKNFPTVHKVAKVTSHSITVSPLYGSGGAKKEK